MKKEVKYFLFFISNIALLIFSCLLIYKTSSNQILSYNILNNKFIINNISSIFITAIIFLKSLLLFSYKEEISSFLNKNNFSLFLSVNSINIFSIIGLLTTQNILNLFIFLEIFTVSFFAILAITKDKKLISILSNHFILNIISSLILLFIIFSIYISFSSFNIDIIAEKLSQKNNSFILKPLSLLFFIIFVIKFFPFTIYFKNLKTNNLFSNFIISHNIFILSNIGIFLILKFSSILFVNSSISEIFLIILFIILLLSCYKLIFTNHLKIISINFCLISILSIFLSLIINDKNSIIYYFLSFNLVGFFLFSFSTFLKRKFNSSRPELLSFLSLIESKQLSSLLLIFKTIIILSFSLPFSFLFYGNYHIISSIFGGSNHSFIIKIIIPAFIFISNLSLIISSFRILSHIINPQDELDEEFEEMSKIEFIKYLSIFLIILVISYILILNPQILSKLHF